MNKKREAERAHIHTYVPSLFVIILVASFILDALFPKPIFAFAWALELGTALIFLGSTLVYIAHVSSRKIRKSIKEIVHDTSFFVGPYAYIRHPGYTGMVVIGIGFSLLINSLIIAVSTIIFYLIARIVAHAEEQHLLNESGEIREAYARYIKKVGRYF